MNVEIGNPCTAANCGYSIWAVGNNDKKHAERVATICSNASLDDL